MSKDFINIHTVYIPVENIMYIKDWIEYHMSIGVKHFYLYDNSGSIKYGGVDKGHLVFGNDKSIVKDGVNKYGHQFKEIPNLQKVQDSLFAKYPITKISWQPKDADGNIVYNHSGSISHLKQNYTDSGMTAFIDMDEYIVKNESFRPSRLLQNKYESRFYYGSVFDIKNGLPFRIKTADSKCIVDMAEIDINKMPETMHFLEYDLPISNSWYNHYNYNKVQHDWIVNNSNHEWIVSQGYSSLISGDYDSVYSELPSLRELNRDNPFFNV